jgi:hypothetical protein
MANPAPKAYAVSPAIVPAAGGRLVQMVTANVDPASVAITVGGTAVAGVFMDSRFLGQFTVPAKTAGAYDLVVTTTDGTSTLVGAFRYV